ncbi:hypothetical protein NC651_000931 [Populus alba x Populus x berolinensis]|nr:hypothetical protein NC651_000931 [Populus alba x Populus x berolinensis]
MFLLSGSLIRLLSGLSPIDKKIRTQHHHHKINHFYKYRYF